MITNRSSDRQQQQRLRALAAQWIIILQIFNSGNQYGHLNCMCCTYVCTWMCKWMCLHTHSFLHGCVGEFPVFLQRQLLQLQQQHVAPFFLPAALLGVALLGPKYKFSFIRVRKQALLTHAHTCTHAYAIYCVCLRLPLFSKRHWTAASLPYTHAHTYTCKYILAK